MSTLDVITEFHHNCNKQGVRLTSCLETAPALSRWAYIALNIS